MLSAHEIHVARVDIFFLFVEIIRINISVKSLKKQYGGENKDNITKNWVENIIKTLKKLDYFFVAETKWIRFAIFDMLDSDFFKENRYWFDSVIFKFNFDFF